MHVLVESFDAIAHLALARLKPVEPFLHLAKSLVDSVQSLVDSVESPVDLLESLVELVEPLVDSTELFFRHALPRSRDDDDTSSGG
jgi:hypothetical protein